MMIRIISNSVEDTEILGEKLAKKLKNNQVIALYGTMGMGKTAFVRGVARGLNISDDVCSPTFAIVHEYHGEKALYHFDMYRVNSWDDLYSTGFFDYIENGVLIIEWSENIECAIPDNSIKIKLLQGNKDNDRVIEIEGVDDI